MSAHTKTLTPAQVERLDGFFTDTIDTAEFIKRLDGLVFRLCLYCIRDENCNSGAAEEVADGLYLVKEFRDAVNG